MSSFKKIGQDILRTVLIFAIELYRYTLSGLLGGQCRFYPSCSEYALQACKKLTLKDAIIRIIWRVLGCHPWSKGGFEPLSSGKNALR